MPLAYTIFWVREDVAPEDVAGKLEGFSVMKGKVEVMGREYPLGVRVVDLERTGEGVGGVYEETVTHALALDDEVVRVPRVTRVRFHFVWARYGVFLLVASGRRLGSRVSATFSEVLFGGPGFILPVHIPPQRLRELYSVDAEPRQVVFAGLREVAGADTVALYGRSLAQSSLLKSYAKVGLEKYVVYRDERGVFGVSSGGLVLAFSAIEEDEFRSYVLEKILPRAEPPPA